MIKGLKLTLLASVAAMASVQAQAEDNINVVLAGLNESSATERINFSGKLRMLSQRISASACNLNADIDGDLSLQMLRSSHAEFNKIIDALEFGNIDLHIKNAENRPEVLTAIANLRTKWRPINAAADKMIARDHGAEDIATINAKNLDLLKSAQNLVSVIKTTHATAGNSDDGLTSLIDVAGRQRMLTQKMSKEACQIWSGDGSAETIAALEGTMQLFEQSLINLRDGNDTAGIASAPNARIKTGLEGIWTSWAERKPVLAKAQAAETVDEATRGQVLRQMNEMLRSSNNVVGLYAALNNKAGIVEDVGATERINFSGKLRMLSQRIAANACLYNAGIEPKTSRKLLSASSVEFDKIANALEFGDADLRIRGVEERRKTLFAIAQLREQWAPIKTAVDDLVRNGPTESAMATIASSNMELLGRAKLLVSELSGQYSDPSAMDQADAMAIDISGRQRMLTQKMLKEACLIWTGNQSADAKGALNGTMQMFEVSLNALLDGLPAAGIQAAPTAEISDQLKVVFKDWAEVKPVLLATMSGETVDDAVKADGFHTLNTTLKDMNQAVGMYTQEAKTGL